MLKNVAGKHVCLQTILVCKHFRMRISVACKHLPCANMFNVQICSASEQALLGCCESMQILVIGCNSKLCTKMMVLSSRHQTLQISLRDKKGPHRKQVCRHFWHLEAIACCRSASPHHPPSGNDPNAATRLISIASVPSNKQLVLARCIQEYYLGPSTHSIHAKSGVQFCQCRNSGTCIRLPSCIRLPPSGNHQTHVNLRNELVHLLQVCLWAFQTDPNAKHYPNMHWLRQARRISMYYDHSTCMYYDH